MARNTQPAGKLWTALWKEHGTKISFAAYQNTTIVINLSLADKIRPHTTIYSFDLFFLKKALSLGIRYLVEYRPNWYFIRRFLCFSYSKLHARKKSGSSQKSGWPACNTKSAGLMHKKLRTFIFSIRVRVSSPISTDYVLHSVVKWLIFPTLITLWYIYWDERSSGFNL